MKTDARLATTFAALLLVSLAGCSGSTGWTRTRTTFALQDGAVMDVADDHEDDSVRLVLEAKNGRIYRNGVDFGPYVPGTRIEFPPDGSLLVGDDLRYPSEYGLPRSGPGRLPAGESGS